MTIGGGNSHNPDHAKLTRRGFLGVGVAAGATALAGWALSEIGEKPARKVLPKAALVMLGGHAEMAGDFKLFAESIGVTIDDALNPDQIYNQLSPEDRQKLIEMCDFAGIFAEIRQHRPFAGKRVVCVTSAADDANGNPNPAKALQNAREKHLFFRLLGAGEVVIITNKEEADAPGIKEIIEDPETALCYFAGGAQKILVEQFAGTKAHAAMLKRYIWDPNFTIAGNSAGMAAMAGENRMIGRWNQEETGPEMCSGLGFCEYIIPETHTHRNELLPRLPRLQKALSINEDCIGLAADERTGAIIQNGKAKVIGQQKVWKLHLDHCNLSAAELEALPAYTRGDTIELGKHAWVTTEEDKNRVARSRR